MTLLQFEIALCIGLPAVVFAVAIALDIATTIGERRYWASRLRGPK